MLSDMVEFIDGLLFIIQHLVFLLFIIIFLLLILTARFYILDSRIKMNKIDCSGLYKMMDCLNAIMT